MADKKKLTKKDFFQMVLAIVEDSEAENKEDLVKFLNHEVELLENKSTNKKATTTQKVNVEITATILEVMKEVNKPVMIADLLTDSRLKTYVEGDETKAMSGQKLSALVSKLVKSGEVVRTEEKKKAYFSIAK